MSDANHVGAADGAPVEAASGRSPFTPGKSVFLGVTMDTRASLRRSLVVLVAGLVLTGVLVGLQAARRQQAEARRLAITAARHATDLHNQIQQSVASLYTVATWVLQSGGDVPRFESLSAALLPAYRGVVGIDLAPDAVVSRAAPRALLGPLVGRNLQFDPHLKAAVSGAIDSRNLYFGGPTLIGSATRVLVARLPVFKPEGTGGRTFWGLIGGYLGLDALLQGARIGQLPGVGYDFTLRQLNADGSPGVLLAGQSATRDGAEEQTLHLPGMSLRLSVWPRAASGATWTIVSEACIGIALSVLAAALVGANARRRQAGAAAMQAVAESGRANERFSVLIEAMPEAVLLAKPDGRIVLASTRAEELFGLRRTELLGRPLSLVLPALADEGGAGQASLPLTGSTETQARRADGLSVPVSVQSGRLDAGGTSSALFCHVVQRRTGAPAATPSPAVAAEAPHEPDLFLGSPSPGLLLRADGVIQAANPAAADLFSVARPEDLEGRRLGELLTETRQDGARTDTLLEQQLGQCTTHGATRLEVDLAAGAVPKPVALRLVQVSDDPAPLLLAVVEELASLRAVEEELATIRQRFLAVTGGLRDWESWMGLEGEPLWIGGQVQAFTGCTAQECLSLADYPLGFVHEDDRGAVREALVSALQGTSGSNFEFRVRRQDGQIRRVTMAWRPVFDDRRRPLGYRLSIREGARAVAVPEPVRPEKDTVELALDNADIGVWDWNLINGQNVWDERMLRLFGLDPEEFARSHDAWRKRLHPEDTERVDAAIQAALGGDGTYEVEHRVILPDGGERSLASRGRVVRDDAGQPVRIIGATWDTTLLRQAEDDLHQRHDLMRTLLDSASGLVHVKDADGRYLLANQAWCEFFQLQPQNVAGHTDAELLPPELAGWFADQDARIRERLQPERSEETWTVGDRTRRFLCERVPLLDGGERLYATVLLATDITGLEPSLPGGEEPVVAEPPVVEERPAAATEPSPARSATPAEDSPTTALDPREEPAVPAADEAEDAASEPETVPSGPPPPTGSERAPDAGLPSEGKAAATVEDDEPVSAETPAEEEAERPPIEFVDLDDDSANLAARTSAGPEPALTESGRAQETPELDESADVAEAKARPRASAKGRAARKRRPKPVAPEPQDLLPGILPPAPVGSEGGEPAEQPAIAGIDVGELRERQAWSAEETLDRLVEFAARQRRLLTELRDALEDGNEESARRQAHELAEVAGDHAAEELRRLAKTVELAIRYREAHLPAMVTELEAEVRRLGEAIEPGATEGSAPGAGPDPLPRLALELLDHLVEALEEEEREMAAEALQALADQKLPPDVQSTVGEIAGLLEDAELPEAAALARGLRERLG
ncbi:MAG: PAS domain-containing protein [Verrucomicrobiales bacterium]|nr:PAS domain-containing protein [Verrucomicrobiales bacterium]